MVFDKRGDPNGELLVVKTELEHDKRAKALIEELHLHELRRLLGALAEADVPVLITKGTALAYSHYREPFLRERFDTDLFISSRDLDRAFAALAQAGFTKINSNSEVHRQAVFTSIDRRGIRNAFDIHWAVLTPIALRNILDFNQALDSSVAVPRISATARRLNDIDSLVLACVHWAGHHFLDPDPRWITDIELLCEGKSQTWWSETEISFKTKKVASIGAATLKLAKTVGSAQVPESVITSLESIKGETDAKYFLSESRTKLTDFIWDVRCLHSTSERLKFIQNHLFPPADYMDSKYGSSGWGRRVINQISRIVQGAPKLKSRTRP